MAPTREPASWGPFAAEVLAFYGPPLTSAAAAGKVRQVLDLFAALPGVEGPHDLTAANLARFARECARTRNPRTVNGLLDYLRAVCNHALAEGYILRSPFDRRKVKLRVGPPTRVRHLSREEIARVLAHLAAGRSSWEGGRLHALASLVAFTGLRKMEALCLEAGDVNLADGYLDVVPRRRLKTEGSAAPVPLPDRLVEVLGRWLPRCGSRWIFPGVRGAGPWTGGVIGGRACDRLRLAGEAAGVKGVNFLAFRHSWATHAEYWGLGELVVQRVLRHTSPLTQRHYRHADLVNLREAVRRIGFGPWSLPESA